MRSYILFISDKTLSWLAHKHSK